jgi:hypothetical protein
VSVRSLTAGLLGLLAVLLLPVALLVGWVTSVGTDTSQFVTKLTPVASSPEVQQALTDRTVLAIKQQLTLPEPVAAQIEAPLRELVHAIVARPELERAWATGLRRGHEGFLAVMDGERPARVDANGRVLMPVAIRLSGVERVLDRFGISGAVELSPTVSIPLFSADDLSAARRIYAVGAGAGRWSMWIVVALAALTLALARRRTRALGVLGVGGVVAAVAFAALLVVGRGGAETVVADPIGSAVVSAAYALAEDGLMAQTRLALWGSVALLAVAVILGLMRVIVRRRG